MNDMHVTSHRNGFADGYTKVVGLDDRVNVGMEFGIFRAPSGTSHAFSRERHETQVIVLSGEGQIQFDDSARHDTTFDVARGDLFREKPWAFIFPSGTQWSVSGGRDLYLEVAVLYAENHRWFRPQVVRPKDVPSEPRGRGIAGGTMHREVRAIFGDPNAPVRPPESNIVAGEVVNFPGKWSSYPPHYHPHNEVYYYRFDKPQGFGVSVMNEDAYVVHTHDAVKILNCVGHAQVSAPGYAMWYLWFIRQIEGSRYEGNPPFKFFPEHTWINEPDANEKILKPEET